MTSKLRSVLLALVAVTAIAGTASASASAHEFVASKTGTLTGSILEPGHAVFAQGVTGQHWECFKGKVTGSVPSLKSTTLVVKMQYSECVNFAFLGIPNFSVEYEVSAEGKVIALHSFTIEETEAKDGHNCKFIFSKGKAETSTDTFKNSAPVKTITAKQSNEKIKMESVGVESCIFEPVVETAKWTQETSLGVEGGTLQWK